MSTLRAIDLSKRTKTSPYHDRSRDIETALAWNALKKVLTETNRESLFEMVHSVKISEKYVTINTGKPIVNAEFSLIRTALLTSINLSFGKMSIAPKEKIRFV